MDAIIERLSLFDRKGEVEFERGGFDFFHNITCVESFIFHDQLVSSYPNSLSCDWECYTPWDTRVETRGGRGCRYLHDPMKHMRGVEDLGGRRNANGCPNGVDNKGILEDLEDGFWVVVTERACGFCDDFPYKEEIFCGKSIMTSKLEEGNNFGRVGSFHNHFPF